MNFFGMTKLKQKVNFVYAKLADVKEVLDGKVQSN